MRLRSLGFAALAATAMLQSCEPACTPAPAAEPAPTTVPPPPTTLTVTGQGSGHGRGLSAWGAYGMAVSGSTWDQIIDKYYGGTAWGNAANRTIGIRLLWADNTQYTTVISTVPNAMTWNGQPFGSLEAEWVGPNLYNIWGAPSVGCGSNPDWQQLGQVSGPVTFTTTQDENTAAAGNVLGLCRPDGSVTHYRGAIRTVSDSSGANHVINDLSIENYLKGVLPREVPASWGNAANGRGMHSLYAMAVAARSFAHSQNRYPQYAAQTCDTDACQVYGGAARRSSATATPDSVCGEPGNASYECTNTNRAVADTTTTVRISLSTGRVMSGEYSASHGPYSSGVNFPTVDDSASAVPQNPNYSWTRTVAATDIVARYPQLGTFTGAYSERDPTSTATGVWGNRVVLQGTAGVVTVTNLAFRNAFGFPSHGFTITAVS